MSHLTAADSSTCAKSQLIMGENQVALISDINGRIALQDEGPKKMLKFHSGNQPHGQILLLEALEDHQSRIPGVPVIHIDRKPSHNGRRGGMSNVTCGFCHQTGKFQNIADHVVAEHFNLSLWHCQFETCPTSCSRRSDLDRHRLQVHNIARPRDMKAERMLQGAAVSSPADPPSPANPLLSPGPGPSRHSRSRSRSRELSSSRPYPVGLNSAGNVSWDHVGQWLSDTDASSDHRLQSTPSHSEARGRIATSRPIVFNRQHHPTLIPPQTAPPTIREPSLSDNGIGLYNSRYSGSSPSGCGMGGSSSDAAAISKQGVLSGVHACAPRSRMASHAFGQYDSSNFLSPLPHRATGSSGIGWRPLSAPVHRVTTPIQSSSVPFHATCGLARTQGIGHLQCPAYPLLPQPPLPFLNLPSTASFQHYYPFTARISMPNADPSFSLQTGAMGSGHNVNTVGSFTPSPLDEEQEFNFLPIDDMFNGPPSNR